MTYLYIPNKRRRLLFRKCKHEKKHEKKIRKINKRQNDNEIELNYDEG